MVTLKKKIRCAIYTRKSTSEGLESELNSLDVQRLAAENYIKSQESRGWYCLAEQYNDGGYTGANMDRPALTKLISDIKNGRIDCLVVYKVDRLSRSLLDFAKMITLLEMHQVSFVSVTQDFNTATSMGRLTLNILLSFAQFERELISERTRDKIAASRKQGRWSGGRPVLGYDIAVDGGRLQINECEAEQVRRIFECYLETGSVLETGKRVERLGWHTKRWTFRNGRTQGGKPFDKNRICGILKNILYTGRLRYQNQIYEGQHERIISDEIWEATQAMLSKHRRSHTVPVHGQSPCILAGVLRCSCCGSVMTPAHCTKGIRRYRYYRCKMKSDRGTEKCRQPSIPATEIEEFIVKKIQEYLSDQNLGKEVLRFIARENQYKDDLDWKALTSKQKYLILHHIVRAIEFNGVEGIIKICFQETRTEKLKKLLKNPLELRFHFLTQSHGKKQIVAGSQKPKDDKIQGRIPRITRWMALAIQFDQSVHSQEGLDFAAVAREHHITRARMSQIMALVNLAPHIQRDILFMPRSKTGRDPVILNRVLPIARQPDWQVQRQHWQLLFAKRVISIQSAGAIE